MRTNQRSKQTIWYALYTGLTDETDSEGNLTGEHPATYTAPIKARMNVSGGKGQAAIEAFGMDNPFTRTAVTDDLKTPFDTDTVFWFGIEPFDKNRNPVPHNHQCVGISRTINGVTIALKELDISHANGNTPIISG